MTLRAIAAFACAALFVSGPASAQFTPPGPSFSCLGDKVLFNGVCVGETWIEGHLATDDVVDFGDCADAGGASACDLYFTQLTSTVSGGVAGYTSTTWMMSDEPCVGGAGCVGGFIIQARNVLRLEVDANEHEVRGRHSLYGPRRKVKVIGTVDDYRVGEQLVGYTDFVASSGHSDVAVYDADGNFLNGYSQYLEGSFSHEWCTGFVDDLVEYGSGAVSAGVGTMVGAAISFGVSELAAAAAVTGPAGFVVGFGIWASGTAIAAAAGTIAAIAVNSGLKAAASHMELNSICDEIAPEDPDGTPPGIIPPTFEPTPIGGSTSGCMECESWGTETFVTSHYDSDGELTIEYHEETVCTSWSTSLDGTDSNGDGWCD